MRNHFLNSDRGAQVTLHMPWVVEITREALRLSASVGFLGASKNRGSFLPVRGLSFILGVACLRKFRDEASAL